jgi:hypothetical protein
MFGMLSQILGLRIEVMQQQHLGEKADTILYWFAAAPGLKGLVACFTSSITSKTQQLRELAPSRVPNRDQSDELPVSAKFETDL